MKLMRGQDTCQNEARNIHWKVTFLANASLAFNVEKAVSGYRAAIEVKEKEVNELHRQLGKRTAELEWWTSKKLINPSLITCPL
jgi:hypothetical protein